MAPCMGPMSPVRAHSLWAGLCPEKLVKLKKKTKKTKLKTYSRPFCCRLIPPKMFREWKALFLEGLPIYEDEVAYLAFYSLVEFFFK